MLENKQNTLTLKMPNRKVGKDMSRANPKEIQMTLEHRKRYLALLLIREM